MRGFTHVKDGLDWERSLNCDLNIQSLHVLAGTGLMIRTEENRLELGNIWSDLAKLVDPLVLAAATIPLAIGVLARVVDGGCVDPTHLTRLLKALGLDGLHLSALGLGALLLGRGRGWSTRRRRGATVVGAKARHDCLMCCCEFVDEESVVKMR